MLINKYFGLILVFAIGLIPLISLLTPGLPLTHDGKDHVARIANFYQSLSEGNIIPRWAGNLNWGYGHPVMMFLYPLSSYIASVFHFVGFSLSDSVKLVFAVGFVGSGITMYYWAREQFDEYAGIAASILYMYAPYRFVDLYVRGAIGEHVAFVFPPLILLFLLRFFKGKNINSNYRYFVLIAVSVAILILAHNAISIMFLPVIVGYLIFLAYSQKNLLKAVFALIGIGFGLGLSSFFLLPAFLEGKYTLRDIVTGDEYKTRFVDPIRLLYSKWSFGITGQFSIALGFIHLLGILFAPYVFFKLLRSKTKNNILIYCALIVFFFISIFLTLSYSQFVYDLVTTLKKFQFPWRFLSLSVFTTSVITGMVFLVIKDTTVKRIILLLGILITVILSKDQIGINGSYLKPDSFYTSIYEGTTDTGESSPIWSVRFMEAKANDYSQVIDGKAIIKHGERKSTYHSYVIDVVTKSARIRENTLYFPGWKIYDNGGAVSNVEYQDPSNRGVMTYVLLKGRHNVVVRFEDTKVRVFANIISFTSIIILVGGFLIVKKRNE